MKQYAASPVIQKLVSDRDTYFPIGWQDQFYDNIWNVDTAQTQGLDIWGRIVGVNRNLQIPGSLPDTFGFSNGTTPADWRPFNQGTFSSGPAATQTYSLSNDAFRVLILAKALTNISNDTAPSLNRILQNLFPGRGRCYVNDLGSMQMSYTFEFPLQPWEQTVLTSGGALPRPAGVKLSVAVIPTGDSGTFGFAEQGIGPVSANGTPQVFRNDWQGVQLLYVTSRTNQLTFSSDFTNASWSKTGATIAASAQVSPDGASTMQKIVEGAVNSAHRVSKATLTSGSIWIASVYAKAADRSQLAISGTNIPSNGGGTAIFDLATGTVISNTVIGSIATITPFAGGIYRCDVQFPATLISQSLVYGVAVASSTSYLGDGVSGIYIWGAQQESGSTSTSYIPTSASTVTVTDYSATATQVTLSSPLLVGATLLWTGTYTSRLTGQPVAQSQAIMGSGDGSTSVYPFSGIFMSNTVAPFNQGTFLSTGAVNNAA